MDDDIASSRTRFCGCWPYRLQGADAGGWSGLNIQPSHLHIMGEVVDRSIFMWTPRRGAEP